MNWQRHLRGLVKFEEPLRRHTTLKIGGPARFFVQPNDVQGLKSSVIFLKKRKIPVFVLGAGSNILASDRGVRAAVIKFSAPAFAKISAKGNHIETGSGVSLSRLTRLAQQHGLSGLEFLAGIPGTVGGALCMNAGAWGGKIGDLVENVQIMDYNGNIKLLRKKEIVFSYRSSSLSGCSILSASFLLRKANRGQIKKQMRDYISKRIKRQDLSFPNAGSIFKNPAGTSAGQLIEACGLKGTTVGGARISKKHANFILNIHGAAARDVLKLITMAQKNVQKRFRISLEPEIKIWK